MPAEIIADQVIVLTAGTLAGDTHFVRCAFTWDGTPLPAEEGNPSFEDCTINGESMMAFLAPEP